MTALTTARAAWSTARAALPRQPTDEQVKALQALAKAATTAEHNEREGTTT